MRMPYLMFYTVYFRSLFFILYTLYSMLRTSALCLTFHSAILSCFHILYTPHPVWRSPLLEEDVDVKLLLNLALKFADLGHSCKPWDVHYNWSMRITHEFWLLGDREKQRNLPVSPLCDRDVDVNLAKSQAACYSMTCRVL